MKRIIFASVLLLWGCHAAIVTMYKPSGNSPPIPIAKIYPDTSMTPCKFLTIGEINARGAVCKASQLKKQGLDFSQVREMGI
jgi:hypothetical protein